MKKRFAVEDFIRRNYDGNFRFGTLHNDKGIELLLNVDKTNNNITFKPLTSRNVHGKEQIVIKRDSNGVFQYNNAKSAQKVVEQFKQLLNEIQKDRDETVRNMPMVEREPLQEQMDKIDRIK